MIATGGPNRFCRIELTQVHISLDMFRVPDKYGNPETHYIIQYNLYTGNGFQNDEGAFHINALLADGQVARDIVSTVSLDLTQCWYGTGRQFRVPANGLASGRTPFDFTNSRVENLFIRVEDARNASKGSHC